MASGTCNDNLDPLLLVRDGTDQRRRHADAPGSNDVEVDERRPEHAIVFAAAFSRFLRYHDTASGQPIAGVWEKFFADGTTPRLAVTAIEDVDTYRSRMKSWLRELEHPDLPADEARMVAVLRLVFDSLGTLAVRLDDLMATLPARHALRSTISNLVLRGLGPMLQRLVGYVAAGTPLGVLGPAAAAPGDVRILGAPVAPFTSMVADGLSIDWARSVGAADWNDFVAVDPADYAGAYGLGTVAEQVNHLATHHLFTAACDAFLAALARIVDEARSALRTAFEDDGHEPHYALFLAFVQLLEHARRAANTMTAKHLDFYYGAVLGLERLAARPARAHVLVDVAKHVPTTLVAEGTLLRAGKDSTGAPAHFAVDRDLVANRAVLDAVHRLYRHRAVAGEKTKFDDGRIFVGRAREPAAPWHPFAERHYANGALTEISMDPAEVGFAIASHQLWLAGGTRTIRLVIQTSDAVADPSHLDVVCRLTTAEGWHTAEGGTLSKVAAGLELKIDLDGDVPPITPYDRAVHLYGFDTSLPMLVVTVRHEPDAAWTYPKLQSLRVDQLDLFITVSGLRSFSASNDHGPVDPSKPFLPFGSVPEAGSSFVIGSHEVFQKQPTEVRLTTTSMVGAKDVHGKQPTFTVEQLSAGTWDGDELVADKGKYAIDFGTLSLKRPEIVPQATTTPKIAPKAPTPELTPDAPYASTSRRGYLRLKLDSGFEISKYPAKLAEWVVTKPPEKSAPEAPTVPVYGSFTIGYDSTTRLAVASAGEEGGGRFFHVGPFGHAEVTKGKFGLVPRFEFDDVAESEGELYLGVSGLETQQNLALLFRVVEGTANPTLKKPRDHVRWSYLAGNSWVPFSTDAVADGTDGLISSGIVTLSVPAAATTDHTVLPGGLHWFRAAVKESSDAVCQIELVAPQALTATYVVRADGVAPPTPEVQPGTITKLAQPNAEVKAIRQPFASFEGRPVESSVDFAARASERLRHKNRAITMWDFERLILGEFPDIHRVRCLNHTRYEPDATGAGVYRELAPGHVTVVTIPDLSVPDLRNPLRPNTSLRQLGAIEAFLTPRMSPFTVLHVHNPEFEEIRVDLSVRFSPGVDETFHIGKLRSDIAEFLSPWAFRSGTRPSFNGTVHKSVVINFVEERSYVDYVSDVRLVHITGSESGDLDHVTGSRAVSVLVSAPPAQHRISPIGVHTTASTERCGCGPEVGT